MHNRSNIVFFGSFLHYSALTLEALIQAETVSVVGVVTTPALVDKKGEHKNPVQLLAEQHSIPVFTPDKLTNTTLSDIRYSILDTNAANIKSPVSSIQDIDLFLTAGYGKLLPEAWLQAPKIASLNLHLSLLPKYRGANPGEWALLMGEKESGVTLIEMSPQFDTGKIIATHRVSIESTDTRETLYQKLYQEGSAVLPELLRRYISFKNGEVNATELQDSLDDATVLHLPPIEQPENGLYARRLRREDGFISWDLLLTLMKGKFASENLYPKLYTEVSQSIIGYRLSIIEYIERASRALAGFPSLWTEIQTKNGLTRMKILEVSVDHGKLILEKVHIAGKQPARWNEVKNSLQT